MIGNTLKYIKNVINEFKSEVNLVITINSDLEELHLMTDLNILKKNMLVSEHFCLVYTGRLRSQHWSNDIVLKLGEMNVHNPHNYLKTFVTEPQTLG